MVIVSIASFIIVRQQAACDSRNACSYCQDRYDAMNASSAEVITNNAQFSTVLNSFYNDQLLYQLTYQLLYTLAYGHCVHCIVYYSEATSCM